MTATAINRLMAGVFLLIFIGFIVFEVSQKPRVLILHSYDTDYSWVQEVSEGINRVFDGKPYSMRWHYMDTKRHPDDEFKKRASKAAQVVIDQWQPHVVISVADNAQRVGMEYINHPNIDIVFSGVFADLSNYGYDETAKNVTGIQERWPLNVIKDGIEQVFLPSIPEGRKLRLRHVGDNSTTGKFIATQLLAYDWGDNIEVDSVSIGNFPEWKTGIETANAEVDLVIFSLYHTLYEEKEGTSADGSKPGVVPPDKVMAWTQENLAKPGLGGWGFYVEQGGMMSIGVSAYEQGEEAAKLAMEIIDKNMEPSELPIRTSRQFLIYLRGTLLKRHNVEVPSIYEAFARANNNYF